EENVEISVAAEVGARRNCFFGPLSSHLANPHVADSHLANPHLANSHLANILYNDVALVAPRDLQAVGDASAVQKKNEALEQSQTSTFGCSRYLVPTEAVHSLLLTLRRTTSAQIAKKTCLKGFGNLVVGKDKGLSQRFP
ncbi:hypothetical protein AVEN_28776-1, partial [Araneus ventricosus]